MPGDDLDSIEVGGELTGDAVYEADSAPHEEQIVRDGTDARAQAQPELPNVLRPFLRILLAPVSPKEHADEAEKSFEVKIRADLEAGLPQSFG